MKPLLLKNLRLPSAPRERVDLYIEQGRFAELARADAAAATLDLGGRLILPGLIETHIHLDKACILERCTLVKGDLAEAIAETARAKAGFSEADIYARGARIIERAITQGTTHMRTHVELDPVIGFKGINAINKLRDDYAWAMGIEICAFPQEGMVNTPGVEQLLIDALQRGADVLGGCPYTDSQPERQITRLFEIAVAADRDLDFHLDFDLDSSRMTLPKVCRQTRAHQWQGRVTVGHATKLAALPPRQLAELAAELADSGVQVTSLPSADLFLNGRDHSHSVPRGVAPLLPLRRAGVTCSISSNNIGNPFTPFGDASLIRQANLYANICQLGTPEELQQCLAWISTESAKLLRLADYGLAPGCWADFIVIDAGDGAAAIAELQQPLMGFKKGRQTFARPAATLLKPGAEGA